MTLTQMANMFLTFAIVLNSEFGSGSVTSYALNAIYLTITAIQFIYALGNDPRDNKEVYQICYIFYGTLFLFTMFCSFSIPSLIASNVLHDDNSRCVRALCRVCLFFRHNRLFDRSRTVLRDYPHYDSISVSFSTCVESRFMLPTFMNIFIIYSFCVNRASQLKFLANMTEENGVLIDRKLNVALTRARRQMFMTGVPELLEQNPVYADLLGSIRGFL